MYIPPYFILKNAYYEYIKPILIPVCLYEKHFKLSELKIKNSKKDTCVQCDLIKVQHFNSNCTSA